MKILKLTDEVYECYRQEVRGNADISRDQAARKLTRNIMLAKEVPRTKVMGMLLGDRRYLYGNLYLIIRHGKVIHIKNHKGKCLDGWELDSNKYHELTKQLGIV